MVSKEVEAKAIEIRNSIVKGIRPEFQAVRDSGSSFKASLLFTKIQLEIDTEFKKAGIELVPVSEDHIDPDYLFGDIVYLLMSGMDQERAVLGMHAGVVFNALFDAGWSRGQKDYEEDHRQQARSKRKRPAPENKLLGSAPENKGR